MKPRHRLWARWRRSAAVPPSAAAVVAEPSHADWLAQLLDELRVPAASQVPTIRATLDDTDAWIASVINELRTPQAEAGCPAADFDVAAKRGRDFARRLRRQQPQ